MRSGEEQASGEEWSKWRERSRAKGFSEVSQALGTIIPSGEVRRGDEHNLADPDFLRYRWRLQFLISFLTLWEKRRGSVSNILCSDQRGNMRAHDKWQDAADLLTG
jgi:hypothetical protein